MEGATECTSCSAELSEINAVLRDTNTGNCSQICLECLVGAATDCANSSKEYAINPSGNFPLLNNGDWTAKEEIFLLENVEHYGLGNWDDVASSIGTRSAVEAAAHYEEACINSNIGDILLESDNELTFTDHTLPDESPNAEFAQSMVSPTKHPVELTPLEQHQMAYLPLRDDFELDHDNQAEHIIADNLVSVETVQSELEEQLMEAHVHMFRRRLLERQRRHAIGRQYQLIHKFLSTDPTNHRAEVKSEPGSSSSKKKSKPDAKSASKMHKSIANDVFHHSKPLDSEFLELKEKMKPLYQLLDRDEAYHFFDDLQKEKDLRVQIQNLQYFRSKGATKFDECMIFSSGIPSPQPMCETATPRVPLNSKQNGSSTPSTPTSAAPCCENGHGNLTPAEETFCAENNMRPSKYIQLKTAILKRKDTSASESSSPSNRNDKFHSVVNFLQSNGWLPVS